MSCKDCKHYKTRDKYKGICLLSETYRLKKCSDRECKRFIKGPYDGLDKNEHNLKLIMKTIANNYKGGRWG